MNLTHLGAPTGPLIRVRGGYANRLYRLDTEQGSFAVKELNLADRRSPYHAEDVFRFERVAGSTALSLAKGPGFDDIEPTVFRSILDGYVAGGGALPPPGPSWFVFTIGGWLGHTRWNILRCLAGVEASTGPDLALSQEVVRNGLRGLPDSYGRLRELEALLL